MDKEKVIKALEDFNKNRICLPHLIPWDEIADAIVLLKEQEVVPIPDRIGDKIPCGRCTNMMISESAYNFAKSYEYGYITDEEMRNVLKNAAKDSRLHEECAEVLIQQIMEKHKPKRTNKVEKRR